MILKSIWKESVIPAHNPVYGFVGGGYNLHTE